MTDRHTKLMELVSKEKRVEVSKLSALLGVSQVTIRKDLDLLEQKGLIKREHGFAVTGSLDDINNRLAYHYETKKKIAQEACLEIQDGETVMIESGSCCVLLADEISRQKRDVTIITNSAFIASYIRTSPYARVVLLGGEYQTQSQVMVGPLTRQCAENFFVEKLFVGTDGFTKQLGFTGNNYMRAQTARSMSKQADKIIVLTESSKFLQKGVVGLFQPDEVSQIYTDDRINKDANSFLEQKGVIVKKVPIK